MRRALAPTFTLIAVLFAAALLEAKPNLPDWLQQALDRPEPPRQEDESPSWEVIWDEAHYAVKPNGRVERNVRFAIRIIDLKERWRAKAAAQYYLSSGSRPKITAWTIHSDGEIYKYKRRDQEERSNSSYLTLETESRTVSVNGWERTRQGDVFAYEYKTTESTIFTQYYWRFQSVAPVAYSKLTISAPEGWQIREAFFYGTPKRSVSDGAVSWEASHLHSKKYEPHSPSSAAKQQYMIATVVPPEGSQPRYTNLNFDTWADLAEYTARISDPKAEPSAEIAAKARELTYGAASDWERIKAVGSFVQSVNYEHIALDLGNGGGYTPRPAETTFELGYGDCKDKSTLLRAMLKAVGIDSSMVLVNATDNDYVDASLPGPFYFNHCITAVEVDASVKAPAVYEDERFGRLLFIDPTWNNSPIGEIPQEAQGGLAVVAKRGPEPLVRLPYSRPEDNKTAREILVELLPNGSIIGRAKTTLRGHAAASERRKVASLNQKEYLDELSGRYAGSGNPSPILAVLEQSDRAEGDRSYRSDVEFGFKGYARLIRDVLVVMKPAILGRIVENPFAEETRSLPVQLRASMLDEETTLYAPDGFHPDEYQDETRIEYDFGSYYSSIAESEDALTYTRRLVIHDTIVPVDRYEELRTFYARVVEAEQTPIVFAKAP